MSKLASGTLSKTPPCDAGYIATYIVDLKDNNKILLPTNYGLIGFTNWNEYITASEKQNDIDYDLALWYENIYIIDWDGNVVSSSSTKDDVIEKALPQILEESGWPVENVKLTKHTRLNPKDKDDLYYGNKYAVNFPTLSKEKIVRLEEVCRDNTHWTKQGGKFSYFYDDYDNEKHFGFIVVITIDPYKGIRKIRKGAYTNPQNAPQQL